MRGRSLSPQIHHEGYYNSMQSLPAGMFPEIADILEAICLLADSLPELWQGSSQAHDLAAKLLYCCEVIGCVIGLMLRVCCRYVIPYRSLEVHTVSLFAVHCQKHGGLYHVGADPCSSSCFSQMPQMIQPHKAVAFLGTWMPAGTTLACKFHSCACSLHNSRCTRKLYRRTAQQSRVHTK